MKEDLELEQEEENEKVASNGCEMLTDQSEGLDDK